MNNKESLIKQQFKELSKIFPGLRLCEDKPGQWVIRGKLSFSASFQNNTTITDTFLVMITLPYDYPQSPPFVQETGGRIPADFHQNPDRTLCLGIPIELRQRFKREPTLLAFVKNLLIPYLYSYSYFEKYGKLPFGEFAHGGRGIREYYQELFKTDDIYIVLELLKIMAEGSYKGHHICPCGSGKILRNCHNLKELVKNYSKGLFLRDFIYVLVSLNQKEKEYIWQEKRFTISQKLQRKIDQMLHIKNKQEKYR